jgi:hypothetical protein
VKRRALVIRSTYSEVGGTKNDVACMTAALTARGFEIDTCDGDAATRAGILAAYDRLIERSESGDAAVVYYTGHGGLTRNASYREGDGLPRALQHLRPTDFGATTDDDFRGISSFELSVKQDTLTRKTPNVTTILECCYSSDMSRDPGVPQPKLTKAGLIRHLDPLRPQLERLSPAGNSLAIRIAACGTHQSALRTKMPTALNTYGLRDAPGGDYAGAMTLGLVAFLHNLGDARVPWRSIATWLRGFCAQQRPEIEGPTTRVPFTLDEVTTPSYRVRETAGSIEIDAGRVLGVSPGDIYDVRRAGSPQAIATVTVDDVTSTHALARVTRWHSAEHVIPYDASTHTVSLAPARYPVSVASPALAAAVAVSPRLRVASAKSAEPWLGELRESGAGHEIVDRDGQQLFPSRENVAEAIADLDALANVRRLHELVSDCELPATVTLGVAVDGLVVPLADHGDYVGLGDRIALRIETDSDRTLYAHVFNVGIRARVTRMTSAPSGHRFAKGADLLLGGAIANDKLLGWRLRWPDRFPRDRARIDRLLVIVTLVPVDLSALVSAGSARSADEVAVYWRDYLLYPIECACRSQRIRTSKCSRNGCPKKDGDDINGSHIRRE